MNKTGLLFPHQLFEKHQLLNECKTIYLVEEFLFFKQYHFHKQKIAFHRASMKFYENYLQSLKIKVVYIDSFHKLADVRMLIKHFKTLGINRFEYIDTNDCWLELKINSESESMGIKAVKNLTLLFICSYDEITSYFFKKNRMLQNDFYKYQRKKRKLLMEHDQKPIKGKWSFDDENRLKYPKGKTPPKVDFPDSNKYVEEALAYTQKYFATNYGKLNTNILFPTNFSDSKIWFKSFLKFRFREFGAYEDTIVQDELFIHHSGMSPMLNVGLISPQYLIDEVMAYAEKHEIPINSLEGFIRQIIGWREFIRAVYELKGSKARSTNFWGFNRKIPKSCWNATTGIEPIDNTIKKVIETGYCHHIERLMVLGNFMLLCEFDPDEVYRWFMEHFIDAFDWVMVPNVYGMSQFADGGLMSTKPYISGSNYLMKMGNYKKGKWQDVWDGLFWHFVDKQRDFLKKNPRLGMMVKLYDKMDTIQKENHLKIAKDYLSTL